MTSRRLLWYVLCLWCWIAQPAHAQVIDEVLLVVDLRDGDRTSTGLVEFLEAELNKVGRQVQRSSALTTAQRHERDTTALIQIALANKARLLLWGELVAVQDNWVHISLRLYDTARPQAPELLVQRACPRDQLQVMMLQLADQLFSDMHGSITPRKPPPVATERRTTDGERIQLIKPKTMPLWQRNLGITLAAGGFAFLASAITLTGLQQNPTGNGCKYGERSPSLCSYNESVNVGLYTTGYVAAGLMGVGAWLSFALY